MRIFLSYASEQKNIAEPIAFSLRQRGHKVFLDKDDLPAGASYDDQIEEAIATSDVFLFLISPESVTKGRFTLTELSFARKKWPLAHRNILPVMAVPTAFDDVPNYLKAVTVLEPQGSIAAEVASAVDDLRRGVPARIIVPGMAGLGLLSGLASALVPNFLPVWDTGQAEAPIQIGIFFAFALCTGMYYWQRSERARLVVVPVLVVVGWVVAMYSANHLLAVEHPLGDPALSGISDDAKKSVEALQVTQAYLEFIFAGMTSGFVGALFTYIGSAAAEPRLRGWDKMLLVVGAGALLGSSLILMIHLPKGSLFVIWQSGVAASIGFALSRPLK